MDHTCHVPVELVYDIFIITFVICVLALSTFDRKFKVIQYVWHTYVWEKLLKANMLYLYHRLECSTWACAYISGEAQVPVV